MRLDGDRLVCPEVLVHESLEWFRVLEVLRLVDVAVGHADLLQFLEVVLERPQCLRVSFLVFRDAGQAHYRPFVRLDVLEVSAQVSLVKSLHDDDDRGVPRVDSVSYRRLESSVHPLSHHVAECVLRLDGVVDDDCSCESVRLPGYVNGSGSESGYLSERRGCVDASSLLRVPSVLGVRSVFYPCREQLLVCLAVDDVLYRYAVVHCQCAGVGQVYETGGGVDGQSFCDEVLHGHLRLSVSWCNVDDELPAFACEHLVECLAYRLVVIAHYELLLLFLLEEVTGEMQGVLQCPCPANLRACHPLH